MKMSPRVVSVILVFLLSASAGRATTLLRMSLEELAAAADAVARVRCLGSESRWEAGQIWTFTQFEVVETLNGVTPREITVRLPGGRVGHLTATVDGVPRFGANEEVILFLEGTPAGDFSVISWLQGTFRLRRDARTGEERVTQDSSGLAVFDPVERRFRAGGIRNLPLEAFKQRLASAFDALPKRRQP